MMFPIWMQISVAKTPSTDSWRRLSNSGSSGSKSLTCGAKRGLKRANIQKNARAKKRLCACVRLTLFLARFRSFEQ